MLATKLIVYLLVPMVAIEGLDPFIQAECGKVKSCMRWSSCDFPTCDFAISWKTVDYNSTNYLQIEIAGLVASPTSGYLAMGFSLNNKMLDNGVVACNFENGNFNISAGYNLNHKNYLLPEDAYDQNFLVKFKDTIYGIEFDSQKNILRCRFLRLMDPTMNADKLKKLTGGISYFVFSAKGAVTNGALRYHYTNKRPTFFSYDMQSKNWIDIIIDSPSVLVKLHGCFMIIGWIFLATNGIIMANFYKGNWPAKQLFKGKIWFQVHRMVQSTCVIFVSVGFILIFVSVRGYSTVAGSPNAAHPVLGIIATGLMFTNLIMAFFRCHPEDSKRWIFNRLHLVVGTSAYVLAIVTIIIGIQLPPAGPSLHSLSFPWILVTIFLVLIILLFIYGEIRQKTKERVSNSVTLNDNLPLDSIDSQKRPSGYEVITISVFLSFAFGIMSIVFVSVY